MFRILLITGLLLALEWQANGQHLGLAPSTNSLGRAEAVVAASYGTDALFYNPACLAFNRINLRIAGLEDSYGFDEQSADAALMELDGPFTIDDYFRLMSSQERVYGTLTVRAVDVSTPYFGASSFVRSVVSAHANEDQSGHEYRADVDGGVIAGAALRYNKISIGYSQYGIVRAQVHSNPTNDTVRTINEAINAETFAEDTVPFRDFTDFYYGGARGHNVGLMYYWWEDNLSGVGLSVLNVGGTKFKDEAPFEREDVRYEEEKFLTQVNEYNLDLQIPDGIPQTVNFGLNLGLGGDSDSFFDARLGLDIHDLTGKSIKQKFAASYDFGLIIPDRLAMAFTWPIFNTNLIVRLMGRQPKGEGSVIHMGLLGLRAFGGIKGEDYIARGAGVGFHFGYEHLVSLLKLDLEWFRTEPLKKESKHITENGFRAMLGLTLMF